MKEFLVFVHSPESSVILKVEVVRARSRRAAMKKLQKLGFKKKGF